MMPQYLLPAAVPSCYDRDIGDKLGAKIAQINQPIAHLENRLSISEPFACERRNLVEVLCLGEIEKLSLRPRSWE
jgi:hypothetical protein